MCGVSRAHEHRGNRIRDEDVARFRVGEILDNRIDGGSGVEELDVVGPPQVDRIPWIDSFIRRIPFAHFTARYNSLPLLDSELHVERGKINAFDEGPILIHVNRRFPLALLLAVSRIPAFVESLATLALPSSLSHAATTLGTEAIVVTAVTVHHASVAWLVEPLSSLTCLGLWCVVNQSERRFVVLVFIVEHVCPSRELLLVSPWVLLDLVPVRDSSQLISLVEGLELELLQLFRL
mmetsp:Transcript_539/g.1022  ORF Transcript_539/g.1022 Transcript_539/m.1022 type:complete len:236 (+) Transcript_539:951-1658(+)